MRIKSSFAFTLCMMAALALGGCADPADETPDAQVSESSTAASAPEEVAESADAAPVAADATTYTFTPATKVEFEGSKVTGSHTGGFSKVSGSISVPGEDLTQAAITATIDMKSTYSDNDGLTQHLMNEDFFEVETYPVTTFVSTSVAQNGDKFNITGDFTLHGVTKSIKFPAMLTLADGKVTAHAEFDINRMDFGIKYEGKADDLIRPNVVIRLHIEAAA